MSPNEHWGTERWDAHSVKYGICFVCNFFCLTSLIIITSSNEKLTILDTLCANKKMN